jgi:hypothetical protein
VWPEGSGELKENSMTSLGFEAVTLCNIFLVRNLDVRQVLRKGIAGIWAALKEEQFMARPRVGFCAEGFVRS